MNLHPAWILKHSPPDTFPDVESALTEPNGLLAVGGDLTPNRLLCAYRKGIFPWYSEDEPVLWWCPDPRAVLFPDRINISRSLRKTLKQAKFQVTMDGAFEFVIRACAAPRAGANGTWITAEMLGAYLRLHELGYAHSVECWDEDRLVGGLYGVALGRVFFGESMFSRANDASKVALAHLCRQEYELIDCQLPNDHLTRMGALEVPRTAFKSMLDRWCDTPEHPVRARRR